MAQALVDLAAGTTDLETLKALDDAIAVGGTPPSVAA